MDAKEIETTNHLSKGIFLLSVPQRIKMIGKINFKTGKHAARNLGMVTGFFLNMVASFVLMWSMIRLSKNVAIVVSKNAVVLLIMLGVSIGIVFGVLLVCALLFVIWTDKYTNHTKDSKSEIENSKS